MENTGDGRNSRLYFLNEWSKEESEELALIYLEDYYRTMDETYLKEALQISKDERLDFQKIMHRAKNRMA